MLQVLEFIFLCKISNINKILIYYISSILSHNSIKIREHFRKMCLIVSFMQPFIMHIQIIRISSIKIQLTIDISSKCICNILTWISNIYSLFFLLINGSWKRRCPPLFPCVDSPRSLLGRMAYWYIDELYVPILHVLCQEYFVYSQHPLGF